MEGTEVTQQSPMLLKLQANQVQSTGSEDAAKEVIQEEAVTKDMMGRADISTDQHTHHRPETSR